MFLLIKILIFIDSIFYLLLKDSKAFFYKSYKQRIIISIKHLINIGDKYLQ